MFSILLDKDDCTLNIHNCDSNAHCSNTAGSFRCTCNTGYTGSGVSCLGKLAMAEGGSGAKMT